MQEEGGAGTNIIEIFKVVYEVRYNNTGTPD